MTDPRAKNGLWGFLQDSPAQVRIPAGQCFTASNLNYRSKASSPKDLAIAKPIADLIYLLEVQNATNY